MLFSQHSVKDLTFIEMPGGSSYPFLNLITFFEGVRMKHVYCIVYKFEF